MKHFLIKYNYGVEIGARLAYLGHYARTSNPDILAIAEDELAHRNTLQGILEALNEQPNKYINAGFTFVGTTIGRLCSIAPIWMLNGIAELMEMFAVINYTLLKKLYPEYGDVFQDMADTEKRHAVYFDVMLGVIKS